MRLAGSIERLRFSARPGHLHTILRPAHQRRGRWGVERHLLQRHQAAAGWKLRRQPVAEIVEGQPLREVDVEQLVAARGAKRQGSGEDEARVRREAKRVRQRQTARRKARSKSRTTSRWPI